MKIKLGPLLIAGILLLQTSCGSNVKSGYTNPNAPVGSVKRIAVLPFSGVPEANTIGDIISMVLANSGSFQEVVDRTELAAIVREHNLPPDLLDETTIIQRGRLINADALLSGRVTLFEQGQASYPLATATRITISLRLINAETGQLIWTQVYNKTSATRGILAPNVEQMMIKMAEEIANDLARLK